MRNLFINLIRHFVVLAFVVTSPLALGDWKILEKSNPEGPGSVVDVLNLRKPIIKKRTVHKKSGCEQGSGLIGLSEFI